MSITVDFEPRGTYLYAEVRGIWTLDDAKKNLLDVLDFAQRHGFSKILINGLELELEGTISVSSRYAYAEFIATESIRWTIETGLPPLKLACVLVPPIMDPKKLGELVAQNRGVQGIVTDNIQEALERLGVEPPALEAE